MRKTSENIIILLKFVRMMYTQMIIYKPINSHYLYVHNLQKKNKKLTKRLHYDFGLQSSFFFEMGCVSFCSHSIILELLLSNGLILSRTRTW